MVKDRSRSGGANKDRQHTRSNHYVTNVFLFVLFSISFGMSLYIFSTPAYKIDDLKVSFSY